jgi:polygalacturonase
MNTRPAAFLIVLPFLASCLAAQDGRMAVEPFLPPLCTTVDAELKAATGKSLAPEDERKVDTVRIQRAIDHCGKGRAVRLRINGEKDAFLTGPLVMKPEVMLILDRGVTLFASRDASLYDLRMGSCGKQNEVAAGCKPLISVEKADDAGVMGDGTIDGRGGEKMLNGESTWWEFAQEAGKDRVPKLISVDNSDHFTVYRITLRNPPIEAVSFAHGDGLTVWGVHIESSQPGAKPIVTGDGAKNVAVARTTGAGTESAAH